MADHYWHQNQHYVPQHFQPVSSPEPALNRVAADSIHGAHRLLAVYPMASATPTTHVARHMNNLAITANVPTYMQASYNNFHYPSHNAAIPQVNEYSHEISHLSAMSMPTQLGGYWERSRDQCMQVLGDREYPSTSYSFPSQWSQSQGVQSSYQTPALASSIFQRMTPASAYPTPPPPSITPSTSSLAYALGYPPETPQNVSHRFEDSPAFFNSFLEQQSQELAQVSAGSNDHQIRTPRRYVDALPQESPDPLALTSNSNRSALSVTPRKRKSTERVSTPSHKRLHATHSDPTVISRLSAMTGSSTSLSSSKTPRKTLAYVEVPPLPKTWFTPSALMIQSFQQGKNESPDLGGYGSEDDNTHVSKAGGLTSVKSSARRTGDRDDRDPLEKFIALTDDIFDAEDSLPADVDQNTLPKEYFTSLRLDGDQPLLQPNIIRKLTKYITQLARPTKRSRRTTREGGFGGGTPKGKASLADVDSGVISRLLKCLDRSVVAGEDIEPFSSVSQAGAKNESPRKARKIPKARKTPTGVEDTSESSDILKADSMAEETAMVVDESSTASVPTNVDLDQLSKHLDIARDSVLAADCCIALLSSDRLTKQLYSEELINACLSTIKNQLTRIVYPFVEASLVDRPTSALLKHLHKGSDTSSMAHRRQLSELFQALSVALPHINSLISGEAVVMSDAIIIQTVYIAIGPFFVFESGGDNDGKGKKENIVLSTLGNSAMRGLRLDALSLIRGVFARHESQRSWIIEEILTSLIKLSDGNKKAGQFRLRDGRSIKTVSALLLQLVQTSAHDVRIDASQIAKNRQRRFALRRQENINDKLAEPFLDELDLEEVRLYVSGLESASKAAKTIVIFLTQRSGKGKSTKSSNEAEYRAILDNLISDLLAVLYWPEWPAASLLLSVVCKFMVSSLDDVKSSNQADSNAAKNIALDHLGTIAARMRSSLLRVKQRQAGDNVLLPLEEIISAADSEEFLKLLSRHQDIAMHLCKRSSDDQAYDSARELTAATWGQELALALNQVHNFFENSENEKTQKHRDMLLFGEDLRNALRDVWKDNTVDVFDIGSQEEIVRIDQLAEEIGTIQSLKNTFGPILNVVLLALDAPQVFMRTKALRALGQIVTSDPSILSASNVRGAIEGHLLDSSPAVRDAAVELIGKYLIDSPAVAGDYYQKIADRIADTGLGVRKRVIRLLKSYYHVTDNIARRVDISTKLILRMLDEDDTVKDLAVKTLEELWFTITSLHGPPAKARQLTKPTNGDKGPLLSKVSVIMGVATNFKDRQSPLEDLLHKMIVDKDGTELTSLHGSYTEICETLIDGLVDASDLPGFTVHTCIRTIFLFTTAYPPVLSGSNASTLLPYLKPATSPEEVIVTDYLLKIFRASVPHMPRTSVKFGQELQLLLQPMILKPSTIGGVQGLQESVACMCAVVQNLTHDFNRLVALVKSCNARLQQAICRSTKQKMTPVEVRTLSILIFIVSLLGEHCDFDHVRNEYEGLASDLNTVTRGSIVEHIYNSLLKLYEKYSDTGLQGRILQCLGFLFRAQPTLMTLESSAKIMDDTFKSSDEDSHGRLLRIMQDFLTSESVKHSTQSKVNLKVHSLESDVNMEELVGNTDGFADSGVSSAIVQRYITSILDAALSQNAPIQAVAIDILSFTIKQGLAHPLQSFPVIVALETSPIPAISARASALHAVLYSKHTSLLNVRYVISARESFNYQKKIGTGIFKGYRLQSEPVALLQRWYSLVREKRGSRQDFLRSLVKVFDINGALQSSQDDIDFARYMAENFSSFDYKTQEEVLTVIKYLTSVLSTAGMQLIEVLSPSNLLTQLHEDTRTSQTAGPSEAIENLYVSAKPRVQSWDIAVIRSSVIVGMVMLLKAYLKMLYGISEEKCIKFIPGKKSIMGDKAVVKRHHNPIVWDRLPFATTPLVDQDMDNHRAMFLGIWSEDGVTAEPDDDST